MNGFYNYNNSVSPFTLARAEAMSAQFQAIMDGFDLVEQAIASGGGGGGGGLVNGSVEARHLTNDPVKLAAIRDKIGAGGGGGSFAAPTFLADHRLDGDTHDFQAVWRAYRKGYRTIIAKAGGGLGARLGAQHTGKYIATSLPFTGLLPGKTDTSDPRNYEVSKGNLALPEDGLPGAGSPMHGLRLLGEGMGKTVWKQENNFAISFNSKSAAASDNLMGVMFADFTIEGLGDPVATQTGHIFALGGTSGMHWHRVEFRSFNADAVCLWPSPNPDKETHNYSPVWRDCIFNGGNSANRNCISIEDGMFGRVENSEFRTACTNDDGVSVAAIDFEARDKTFYQVANWLIEGCKFYDINRGGVAFYLNGPDYYTIPPRGFTMRGCHFYRCKRLWDFSGAFTDQLPNSISRHGVEITGCYAEDSGDVRFLGMWGVRVHHNDFLRCDIVKFGDAIAKGNRGVIVEFNTFTRSKQNIVVLHDDDTIGCAFRYNLLYDCGLQYAVDQPGYVLIARRGSVGTAFVGNRIENPNGRLKAGFLLTDTATYGATAEKADNRMVGVAYTISDTFNPPADTGAAVTLTITGNITVPGRESLSAFGFYFDVGVPGMVKGRPWVAWWDDYLTNLYGNDASYQPIASWQASPQSPGVLRFMFFGKGGAQPITLPANIKIYAREAA